MKIRGKLIVIEGGDGAGKATQTDLLIHSLRARGVSVFKQDFPRYETIFGAMCGRALRGEFGDFVKMHPVLASALYTLDRAVALPGLRKDLSKGLVISNRYVPSNIAYQAAKLSGKQQTDFISYMEAAEYREIGLPKPDLVIYLYVPVVTAQRLIAQKDARGYMGKRKGAKDQSEANIEYQQRVVSTYRKLSKGRSDWVVINCTKRGKLLSREEIHNKIRLVVERVMKKKK